MKIFNIKLNKFNLSLIFVLIFLIFFKSPCSFYLGRSENGLEVFFDYASSNSFFKSILYVYSEAKYYELFVNFSAIIVNWVSLPSFLITVYFALIVKLILIFYIFFSNSILLKTTLHKFIFASFTIYSTAITPEIWLTTLQSKVFFGMLSFIMIFQNFSKFDKKKFIIYRGALIFNGLSSIFSSIFSIVYFFIYVKERSRINFYNFIFSLIPLLVNFFIFLYFSLKNLAENDRFTFELEKIFNLVYNTSVRPIFGGNLSKLFYEKIAFLDIKFSLLFLSLALIGIFFYYLIKKSDKILNLLFISFAINILLILLGSQYSDFVGGRYAVLSSVIFLTFFLRLIQIEKNPIFYNFSIILISISLVTGLIEFKYFNPWMFLLKC